MEIGERIFVVPEWRDEATPAGRIRIEVNAGLAFGTGAHETTRLCLEAVERHVQPGMTLMDVGTGSGILSEAALKLGALRACACDTDHGAVIVARENFERAGVFRAGFRRLRRFHRKRNGGHYHREYQSCMDAELAPEWVRILKPGGSQSSAALKLRMCPLCRRRSRRLAGAWKGEFGEHEWRMLEVSNQN